ncbi:hypothetical protein LAD74_01820 [Mycoplasma sp. U97]|uniref:hypothetical protein n=1 Tax=Mycoplasma tauri TaxID=547987 RepID=UPI001CBA6C13|nr:hypothetical protein [Mycoplasma tauri]MBZ4212725.1 hypothetical protein [Mycoplasma tauri]
MIVENKTKINNKKKNFYRWSTWFYYMNLQRSRWPFALWSSLALLFFVLFTICIWIINLYSNNLTITILLPFPAFLLICIGISFVIWIILKCKILNIKTQEDLINLKKILITALCFNPFFFIYLSLINKKHDKIDENNGLSINEQENILFSKVNKFNYSSEHSGQTHSFVLTAQYTAINEEPSKTKYENIQHHKNTKFKNKNSEINSVDTLINNYDPGWEPIELDEEKK